MEDEEASLVVEVKQFQPSGSNWAPQLQQQLQTQEDFGLVLAEGNVGQNSTQLTPDNGEETGADQATEGVELKLGAEGKVNKKGEPCSDSELVNVYAHITRLSKQSKIGDNDLQ